MSLAEQVLLASPLAAISRRQRANDLCVLAYHGVTDPAQFARHLDEVVATMNPVGPDDVAEALDGGQLPERAVLITFDDGDRTVLTNAAPALAARSLSAICFVVTSLVDTDTPSWWDEVAAYTPDAITAASLTRELKTVPNHERLRRLERLRAAHTGPAPTRRQLDRTDIDELLASNVTIGNHTHTHPCLDKCTDAEVRDEMAASDEKLKDLVGHRCEWFAYPNGNLDRRAEHHLADMGYKGAFLFDHRFESTPPPQPMRISRLRVNSTTSIERFRLITSGVHPILHRLRGRT